MSHLQTVEGPVCGIFAAALVSGKPFEPVMQIARTVVRAAKHPGWRGRMFLSEICELLQKCGVQFKELEGFTGMTLRATIAELDPERQHLIFITGHFITVRNGLYYDQGHPEGAPLTSAYLIRRRVKTVLRIL